MVSMIGALGSSSCWRISEGRAGERGERGEEAGKVISESVAVTGRKEDGQTLSRGCVGMLKWTMIELQGSGRQKHRHPCKAVLPSMRALARTRERRACVKKQWRSRNYKRVLHQGSGAQKPCTSPACAAHAANKGLAEAKGGKGAGRRTCRCPLLYLPRLRLVTAASFVVVARAVPAECERV